MPKLKSSKKRLRQEVVRQARNSIVKSTMRTAIRKVRDNTDTETMPSLVSAACSKLDKAAKTGLIHKRTASRNKSRLMKAANNS